MIADLGDIVKVPKMRPGDIPGTEERQGKGLVEAEVISISRSGSYPCYTVRRQDGQLQKGNGHMIREIIRKAGETHGEGLRGMRGIPSTTK